LSLAAPLAATVLASLWGRIQPFRITPKHRSQSRGGIAATLALPLVALLLLNGLNLVLVARLLLQEAGGAGAVGVLWAALTQLGLLVALREDVGASVVAAYRPRFYWAEARGIVARRVDSCLGFHLFDLPGKVWRRAFGAPAVRRRVAMASAGYGGVLFRRGVVERIGLPEAGFVLYADDTEWTLRLTRSGGRIVLATDLVLTEMDRTEVAIGPGAFSVRRWLEGSEEFRLFYGARNEAFIDTHRLRRSRLMHGLNRAAVLALLGLFSRGRSRQFALLAEALAAGEAGRLGVEPRFPLPEAR
jgi:hypothetical protein